jgi:hypothetical protein
MILQHTVHMFNASQVQDFKGHFLLNFTMHEANTRVGIPNAGECTFLV